MSTAHLTLEQSLAFDRAMASATGFGRDALAFDRQTLRHFDVDGRMHVERCNISKANVCPYLGREIPGYQQLGLDPNKIYRLYRDPEELARGAATFRNLQLLMLHKPVNAKDPKQEITVGTIGSDVEFNAPYLTASIAVWTADAIKLIQSKKQAQLSCSYRYRADMTPGVTPEGFTFDGTMRDIMGNHVALVEEGRAGSDVMVSDSLPLELSKMHKRPAVLAAVLAALNVTATPEQQLALDAALDASLKAAEDEAEEARKRKAAEDAAKCEPSKMTPAAMDAAISTAIAAGGFISKTEAERLANDAANAAVARVNALHKAREDVKPLVGIVAMDSAEAVYRFALEKSQVALDGVPPAAFGALVEQVKARKVATPAPSTAPKFANDAVSAASAAIPALGRFAQG